VLLGSPTDSLARKTSQAAAMAEPSSPEPKLLPQPENYGAWASATKGLLGNAKSVTDELFSALNDKEVKKFAHTQAAKPQVYVNPGPRNKADLDAQLSVTRFAVSTVDTANQRAAQCISRVGHGQQTKWAPLKVCEWRLALRARRPTRELFRDQVTEALEIEQQALLDSRVKLSAVVKEGKAFLEDCEANKARLCRIVRMMVLMGTAKVPPLLSDMGSPRSPSSPSSPPPEGEEASPASPKKPAVPTDSPGLLKRAGELEEMALRYVAKADASIKHQKSRVEKAREVVDNCFQKRWKENEELKKSLEKQIQEMVKADGEAEKALFRMKKRIDHYGEVELQPKYDAAQAILAKIRESKVVLEDDLHHKMVAMKIDESCRKITPERTAVPPEQLPVLAMLEGPACRKKTNNAMNRTNSSPALIAGERPASPAGNGKAVGRPASPAGASSTLKAAASASLA